MHVRMAEQPHGPKKYKRAHARLIWASDKIAWTFSGGNAREINKFVEINYLFCYTSSFCFLPPGPNMPRPKPAKILPPPESQAFPDDPPPHPNPGSAASPWTKGWPG